MEKKNKTPLDEEIKTPYSGIIDSFTTFKADNTTEYFLPLKEKSLGFIKDVIRKWKKSYRIKEQKIYYKNKRIAAKQINGEYHMKQPTPIKEYLFLYLRTTESEINSLEKSTNNVDKEKYWLIRELLDLIEIINQEIITSSPPLYKQYIQNLHYKTTDTVETNKIEGIFVQVDKNNKFTQVIEQKKKEAANTNDNT